MVKNPSADAGDVRDAEINPWEDPLEEGIANPPQYSCLENRMDRRAWQVIVHRVVQSRTQLK